MLDGVLQEHVSGNIHSEVAVKGVVVNRAASNGAAILSPKMDAIMVIGVRRRIPIGKIVEMVVVNTIAANLAVGAGGDSVIYVVDVGVREREVAPVTRNRPGRIMASDIVNCQIVRQVPRNAINRVCRGQIRC